MLNQPIYIFFLLRIKASTARPLTYGCGYIIINGYLGYKLRLHISYILILNFCADIYLLVGFIFVCHIIVIGRAGRLLKSLELT